MVINNNGYQKRRGRISNAVFIGIGNVYDAWSVYQQYLNKAIQNIKQPTIIITANTDAPATSRFIKYAQHQMVKKWYAQNMDVIHPKIFPMPIGIKSDWIFRLKNQTPATQILRQTIKQKRKKNNLINTQFSIREGKIRCERYLMVQKSGVVPMPMTDMKTYMQNVSQSYFTVSPNGFGIDCFRTWQALYLKSIPIILKNKMYQAGMYEGLPVIALDKWQDFKGLKLDQQLYHKIWGDFDQRTITIQRFMPQLSNKQI